MTLAAVFLIPKKKKNNNINKFKYLLLFPLIDKCSWIINLDLLR